MNETKSVNLQTHEREERETDAERDDREGKGRLRNYS